MLKALLTRSSIPARQLTDPAPNERQLEQILSCAITAPDHAALRPWRFIIIQGDSRKALADVFVDSAKARDPDISDKKIAALREKPLRSPLIVVIVATITASHPKTPEIEQVLSAGSAALLLQLGASALGFGSIWLTGENAYDENVKTGLGISLTDHVIGFVYIGTPTTKPPLRRRTDLSEHVTHWHGT